MVACHKDIEWSVSIWLVLQAGGLSYHQDDDMFTQPEMQYWVRNRTSSPRADGNQQILSAIQQVNSDIKNFKGGIDAQGFHILVDLCTSKLLLVDSSC